jgi:hypothetical protein
MSEKDMQDMQQEVIDMCDQLIARYDWDSAFAKYLEGQ